jgi:hypothetical protein
MAFLLSSGGGDVAWCMQVFIRLRNPSYILLEGSRRCHHYQLLCGSADRPKDIFPIVCR